MSAVPPVLMAQGRFISDTTMGAAQPEYVIDVTTHGRTFSLIVDQGTSQTSFAGSVLDSLDLHHTAALKVDTLVRHGGVEPVPDTTATTFVVRGDTTFEFWELSDREEVLDWLTLGASAQRRIAVAELPSDIGAGIRPNSGLLGVDVISQFDVEYNAPGGWIRLYAPIRGAHRSNAPPWLPPGLKATDCTPADTVGVAVMLDPPASAGHGVPTSADTLAVIDSMRHAGIYDQLVALQNFMIPITVNGHALRGIFDSGAYESLMDWRAARLSGLMPTANVSGDTSRLGCYRSRDFTACYQPKHGGRVDDGAIWEHDTTVFRIGRRVLSAPIAVYEVWPFQYDWVLTSDAPHLNIGISAFRNRVLFLSYSTGMVCVSGPVQPSKKSPGR